MIGFASAGVHANGFTLVRRVLEEEDYDGDDLLAPTRLYLDVGARAARAREGVRARHRRRHPRQPRARRCPTGCARSSTGTRGSARRCSRWLARHVDEDELRRVFNLGIGWCAVVADAAAGRARDRADRVIGVLVCGNGTNLQALIDAGLPVARRRVEPQATPTRSSARARPASRPRRSRSTATPTATSATS